MYSESEMDTCLNIPHMHRLSISKSARTGVKKFLIDTPVEPSVIHECVTMLIEGRMKFFMINKLNEQSDSGEMK